jgi:hypothetical protein
MAVSISSLIFHGSWISLFDSLKNGYHEKDMGLFAVMGKKWQIALKTVLPGNFLFL